MKTFRRLFYILMAACWVQGMITGIRAYYLVLLVQIILLLASVLMNVWTALSFAYLQKTDERRAVKGDVCNLSIGIYNDKPFPFTTIKVHVQAVSPKDNTSLSFSLMPNSSIDFNLPMALPYRGEFAVGMTYLEITDIFGLARMKFDMRKLAYYRQKLLLVYPRLLILPRLKAAPGDSKHFNSMNLSAAEEGDSFSGARLYRPGDPAKKIHWKLSLRQRRMHSRQFDVPMESRSLIFLHNIPREPDESSLLYADTVCECAAAIARHFLAAEHPVTLVETGARQMSVSAGNLAGFQPVYDWLAHIPFHDDGSFAPALSAQLRKSDGVQAVYMITCREDENLTQAAQMALNAGCQVTCILVDAHDESKSARLPSAVREVRIKSGQDISAILGGAL
ncbi:MAG: DUF58 domain-containing protein [Christensenellales bacterium]|jgi:uncharacterized protein (DUF58 family)